MTTRYLSLDHHDSLQIIRFTKSDLLVTDSGNRYEPNRSQNRQKTTILGVLRSLPFSGCFPSVVLVRKLQFLVFKYIGVPTHFSSFLTQKGQITGSGPEGGVKRPPFWTPLSSKWDPIVQNDPHLPGGPGSTFFPGFSRFFPVFGSLFKPF
jgi:hypothetical protein